MIYVTGANGWLGLNIIKQISNGNCVKWGLADKKITALILKGTSKSLIESISKDINIIECDIAKNYNLDILEDASKSDILFHTAGIIHPSRPIDFFNINTKGTENILRKLKKSKISKIVAMSSNSPIGCNENNTSLFDEKSKYNPYMQYGKSKMEMELLIKDHIKKYDLNATIIRSPWFYGPFQPKRQIKFFEMIKNGTVPLVGNGENIRSMAFTENIVQGMVLAASSKKSNGKTFWISDKKPYTMNEIINTIESLLSSKYNQVCKYKRINLPNITSLVAEKIDQTLQFFNFYNQKIHVLSEMNKNIACDISLAEKVLNYKPEFDLENGMTKCLDEIYR